MSTEHTGSLFNEADLKRLHELCAALGARVGGVQMKPDASLDDSTWKVLTDGVGAFYVSPMRYAEAFPHIRKLNPEAN